ncbi:MAG: hypothetical protein GY745_05060 [Actinomycetia bacterium]|nr:hypothetical protein [Actinomycetes bacterium]MCP4084410.1 hypothetical protein [Actinomycetes bacterium]
MLKPGSTMVPLPSSGRTYTLTRRVRLGDVSPNGRARFDAVARWLQDIANDDAHDANLPDAMSWVVRRTAIELVQPAVFREQLELTTFCSGTGRSWAERRTVIRGDKGAHLETEAIWVSVDGQTGAPVRLAPSFEEIFGESAMGRRVKARLSHDDPPDSIGTRSWPLRFVDFDVVGHVNNAAYWAVVEEELARRRELRGVLRAELEFGGGIDRRPSVDLAVSDTDDAVAIWYLTDGTPKASARVTRIG